MTFQRCQAQLQVAGIFGTATALGHRLFSLDAAVIELCAADSSVATSSSDSLTPSFRAAADRAPATVFYRARKTARRRAGQAGSGRGGRLRSKLIVRNDQIFGLPTLTVSSQEPNEEAVQVFENRGGPVATRTPDLYRVKVAL